MSWGAGLDGGAELTTLFNHDKFLEEKSGMNGRSDGIEPGWWSRRYARGAMKRTRTCITVFGSADPMKVRSLTRRSISFSKPLKPKSLWTVSGSGGGATLLDVARHKKLELGDNLEMAY